MCRCWTSNWFLVQVLTFFRVLDDRCCISKWVRLHCSQQCKISSREQIQHPDNNAKQRRENVTNQQQAACDRKILPWQNHPPQTDALQPIPNLMLLTPKVQSTRLQPRAVQLWCLYMMALGCFSFALCSEGGITRIGVAGYIKQASWQWFTYEIIYGLSQHNGCAAIICVVFLLPWQKATHMWRVPQLQTPPCRAGIHWRRPPKNSARLLIHTMHDSASWLLETSASCPFDTTGKRPVLPTLITHHSSLESIECSSLGFGVWGLDPLCSVRLVAPQLGLLYLFQNSASRDFTSSPVLENKDLGYVTRSHVNRNDQSDQLIRMSMPTLILSEFKRVKFTG